MTTTDKIQEIDVATLKKWLENQEVTLIDVRELDEFTEEHIAEAKLMPLSSFDPTIISQELNHKLVLQCRSGRRSAEAVKRMLSLGLENVFNLQGGLSSWKDASYPIEKSKKAPIIMLH